MIELVVFIQAALIVALVVAVLKQNKMLFSAAMSRTPSEYRKLEQAKKAAPVEAPKTSEAIDEAAAMVIASMAGDLPIPSMPHGMGGE